MNRIIDNYFRNFINVLIFLGCIILPDEDEERCVAEDPEEDIWEDKGDDSQGFLTLV